MSKNVENVEKVEIAQNISITQTDKHQNSINMLKIQQNPKNH